MSKIGMNTRDHGQLSSAPSVSETELSPLDGRPPSVAQSLEVEASYLSNADQGRRFARWSRHVAALRLRQEAGIASRADIAALALMDGTDTGLVADGVMAEAIIGAEDALDVASAWTLLNQEFAADSAAVPAVASGPEAEAVGNMEEIVDRGALAPDPDQPAEAMTFATRDMARSSKRYRLHAEDGRVVIRDAKPRGEVAPDAGMVGAATIMSFGNGEVGLLSTMVLDLDGDGVELRSRKASGARFDLDGNGTGDDLGWVGKGDGFVVADLDDDGVIAGAAELSLLGLAPGAQSSRDALGSLDSNRNGRLDAGDERFGSVKVWVDRDGNGRTGSGELMGLADHGIASIELAARGTAQTAKLGTTIVAPVSTFTRSDGSMGTAGDAWLSFKPSGRPLGDSVASSLARRMLDRVSGLGGGFGSTRSDVVGGSGDASGLADVPGRYDGAPAAWRRSGGESTRQASVATLSDRLDAGLTNTDLPDAADPRFGYQRSGAVDMQAMDEASIDEPLAETTVRLPSADMHVVRDTQAVSELGGAQAASSDGAAALLVETSARGDRSESAAQLVPRKATLATRAAPGRLQSAREADDPLTKALAILNGDADRDAPTMVDPFSAYFQNGGVYAPTASASAPTQAALMDDIKLDRLVAAMAAFQSGNGVGAASSKLGAVEATTFNLAAGL